MSWRICEGIFGAEREDEKVAKAIMNQFRSQEKSQREKETKYKPKTKKAIQLVELKTTKNSIYASDIFLRTVFAPEGAAWLD